MTTRPARLILATFVALLALVAALVAFAPRADATGPGHGHDPVTLCHNGHEITVDDDSVVNAHLRHGDTLGTCPVVEPTEEPTIEPTEEPTTEPTTEPTEQPTEEPTVEPTPTEEPTTPAPNTPTEPAATSTSVTPAPAPVVSEVGTVATPATVARVQLAETGVSAGLGFLVATIAVVLGTAALVARRRHTRS